MYVILAFLWLPPVLAGLLTQDVSPSQMTAEVDQPLKAELVGIQETRRMSVEAKPDKPVESELQMDFRLVGGRVSEIVRVGHPIFDELVDATGKSLLKPEGYTEQDRDWTRVLKIGEKLKQQPISVGAKVAAAAREARVIKTTRGSIRVILASKEREEITIEKPLQYRGKAIEHPRLKEVGIEILMLPAGNPAQLPSNDSAVALQYAGGFERVQAMNFYDGWFQELRSPATPGRTNEGQPCLIYQVFEPLNEDSQMVVDVYARIEDLRVPIEFDDLELP